MDQFEQHQSDGDAENGLDDSRQSEQRVHEHRRALRTFEEFQPSSSAPIPSTPRSDTPLHRAPDASSNGENVISDVDRPSDPAPDYAQNDRLQNGEVDKESSPTNHASDGKTPAESEERLMASAMGPDAQTSYYYGMLELSPSASQDEIKSQYKRLVRLYHPDRFIDVTQKALAEQKFKAINEAYRALSSRAMEGKLVKYAQQAMGLVVEPQILDFGLLDRRQQRTATFQVSFEKDVEGIDFVPSEEGSWFRVAKVSHLYGTHHTSLEFEVEVDTTGLAAQTYQGWIDLYLDDAMTRLPLTLQVAARPWQTLHFSRRWVLAATFLLAFLFFTSTLAFTGIRPSDISMRDNNSQATQQVVTDRRYGGSVALSSDIFALERAIASLRTAQLYFTLNDDDAQPAIYRVDLHNDDTPHWVTNGTQASGVQNSGYVAYVGEKAGRQQIFLYDSSTEQVKQLSSDLTTKSSLAWSADGTYLAYLVGSGADAWIGLYDVARQKNYRLPGEITTGVSNFSWSPDGQSLLFDLWRGNERRVYRMTVPNGDLQQLTQFDSWAGSWSPDGNAIVVSSQSGLYRLDSSGRQARQISSEIAERPLWSADGTWIAFLSRPLEGANREHRLWLIRPDGSGASHVANDILWHAWSPEGATLAYVTGQQQTSASLYYLWVAQPLGQAQMVAEINEPYVSWEQ